MSWGAKVLQTQVAGRVIAVGDKISNGRQRHQVTAIIVAFGHPPVLVLAGEDAPLVRADEFQAGGWVVVAPAGSE